MRITFLGTGTSTGVPQLGCHCEVCESRDFRDKRWRTSALVEVGASTRILLDCGPDFRSQMLEYGFRPLSAVLVTHEHYDHVGGIDDLRPYCVEGRLPVYADEICARHLRERLPYCFAEQLYPGVPQINLQVARPGVPFQVGEIEVLPLLAYHDRLPILGYRLGNLAYLTDVSAVVPETEAALMDIPLLVVNALRHTPHHSHQTLEQAVALAQKVRALQVYFIHMSHQIGLHAQVEDSLPEGMHLAYDGLQVECAGPV